MKTMGIIFGIFILMSTYACADNSTPIDKAEQQCIGKSQDHASMNNCTHEAEAKWDKELNKYYGLLMKRLGIEQRNKLKESQRAWIKFRDLENHYCESIYLQPYKVGSMGLDFYADTMKDTTRKRALDLKGYYEDIKKFNE